MAQVPPSRETKSQRKKRLRFAAKLAKNAELKEKRRLAARSRRGGGGVAAAGEPGVAPVQLAAAAAS